LALALLIVKFAVISELIEAFAVTAPAFISAAVIVPVNVLLPAIVCAVVKSTKF
jgi:hypothetical protein